MGFTGSKLLVFAAMAVVLIGIVIGAYFLVKKAVTAGVREANRKGAQRTDTVRRTPSDQPRGPRR